MYLLQIAVKHHYGHTSFDETSQQIDTLTQLQCLPEKHAAEGMAFQRTKSFRSGSVSTVSELKYACFRT